MSQVGQFDDYSSDMASEIEPDDGIYSYNEVYPEQIEQWRAEQIELNNREKDQY